MVDKGDDVTFSQKGNSAAYLAARIKRDAPEIAAAVERGEYRSMRAAAKAAGIIREKTRVEKLKTLWNAATPEERAEAIAPAWRTACRHCRLARMSRHRSIRSAAVPAMLAIRSRCERHDRVTSA